MAALLRCFRLGHQSLWVDEVLTWYSIGGMGDPIGARELLENIHGPVYSLLLHFWTRIAGDSEWALRFPSAMFGTLTVPLTAWLAARWTGRETAIAAAWLAAGSPFLVWYSQEARNYALLVLCAVGAGAALLALRDRLRAAPLAWNLAATAAGLLSNFSFAFLAPLHLRWWLAAGEARRARRLALAGAAALALLAASPWIPSLVSTWDWSRLEPRREAVAGETPLRGATTFHPAAVPFAAHALLSGYSYGPSLRELRRDASIATLRRHAVEIGLEALVFGVLGLLGIRALARRGKLVDALLWVGVPVLAVSYAAIQNFKVFHPRYVAVAAPALLLIVAAGLADLPRRARIVAALAVAAVWAVSLAHHYFDPRYAKDDMRGAAARIAAHGVAGETVLAVGAEDPLIYYYARRLHGPLPLNTFWLGFAARPERLDRKLDEALQGARGAWIVLSRAEDLDPSGVFERRVASRFPDAERTNLDGITLWHITRAGGFPALP